MKIARQYELTDQEWEHIRDYIPTTRARRPPTDHRQILNGMLWVTKSGTMWEIYPIDMVHRNNVQPF